MKLKDYDYAEIYNTIEILFNMNNIMVDFPYYEGNPDFNKVKKYLDRIYTIHESMSANYKIKYSNNFFKLDLGFLQKEKEELKTTIKNLEKYSIDKAKKIINWAYKIMELIDDIDECEYNIDKVYILIDIVENGFSSDDLSALYKPIYGESIGYFNHMNNYILNLEIPKLKK